MRRKNKNRKPILNRNVKYSKKDRSFQTKMTKRMTKPTIRLPDGTHIEKPEEVKNNLDE